MGWAVVRVEATAEVVGATEAAATEVVTGAAEMAEGREAGNWVARAEGDAEVASAVEMGAAAPAEQRAAGVVEATAVDWAAACSEEGQEEASEEVLAATAGQAMAGEVTAEAEGEETAGENEADWAGLGSGAAKGAGSAAAKGERAGKGESLRCPERPVPRVARCPALPGERGKRLGYEARLQRLPGARKAPLVAACCQGPTLSPEAVPSHPGARWTGGEPCPHRSRASARTERARLQ